MESMRTRVIGKEGDSGLERSDTGGEESMNVTERYVGPSAWGIAEALSHPVSFDGDWFWTTAFCHSTRAEGLAFRQRPDGNGIDVRCHTRGCSREMATDALGGQIGWPIRNAYEPMPEPVDWLWWLTKWPRWRIVAYAVAALAFSAPLLLGHGLVMAYLAGFCFIAGMWITSRNLTRRRRSADGPEPNTVQPEPQGSVPTGAGPSSLPAIGR